MQNLFQYLYETTREAGAYSRYSEGISDIIYIARQLNCLTIKTVIKKTVKSPADTDEMQWICTLTPPSTKGVRY